MESLYNSSDTWQLGYLIFFLTGIKREEEKVVNSRKAQNKLHAAKAHMNSVQMQMNNQLGKWLFS